MIDNEIIDNETIYVFEVSFLVHYASNVVGDNVPVFINFNFSLTLTNIFHFISYTNTPKLRSPNV